MTLKVIVPGARTLIEDAGRTQVAALGVSPSGAADRASYALANRLVDNPPGAAALEVLIGGLTLEATTAATVAVTGAPLDVTVDGRPVPFARPVALAPGQRLALARPTTGLRTYVAVRGGIDAPRVLGSRSADTIAGLGPAALTPGDELPIGGLVSGESAMTGMAVGPYGLDAPADPIAALSGPILLRGAWGPRADWFTPESRRALKMGTFVVGADSDRVGVRLTGPVLSRTVQGELASEPVVRGSIQVPPSGQPVCFLADHPTTGGYPVIAVLDPDSVNLLAQVRPSDEVRFSIEPSPYPTDLPF